MKTRSIFFTALLAPFALLICALCLASCAGGGTRGTGDLQSITIRGAVANESGVPIEGVEVADLQSGASGVSDQSGQYMFQTEASPGEELKILIIGENFQEIKNLRMLNGSEMVIEANIEISTSSSSVTVTSISVNPANSEQQEQEQEQEQEDSTAVKAPVRSVVIYGTLVSPLGERISGVSATLKGIQSQDVSNQEGTIRLEAKSNNTRFTIRLRAEQYDEEVNLSSLPQEGNLLIRITLRVILPDTISPDVIQTDEIDFTPQVVSLSIKKR